ncbi:hypothetical protein [Polynucleobacter sp. Tro8-14-1]|uniref:hypothetical protein n=1 Tax=Polynucleobacter sp. Tro8-14-1 TaxID=1758383 RepID=UPI001C0D3938|nr:hypothetical protein [Polynucleobacter sp. Tro8-14-1]MBU3563846.1 hypothetical protein [Polynucleobacter sp. Tro8-14-1]
MGITLHPREANKSHFLLRLLEFPLLIALILSIALHLVAWKMLPDYEPLPTGKSRGWLKIFLVNSSDSSTQELALDRIQTQSTEPKNPSPSKSLNSEAKPETNSNVTEVPFFMRPNPGQNLLGPSLNKAMPSPNTQEESHTKDRRWETQVRIQSQQRQFQLNQAIAAFEAQQAQRGRPYFCEISLNEDFSAAHLSCEPAAVQQELRGILSGTPFRWQDNKNGLSNIRILGQPIHSN